MYEEIGNCSLHTIALIDYQALYCLYDISHADGMIEESFRAWPIVNQLTEVLFFQFKAIWFGRRENLTIFIGKNFSNIFITDISINGIHSFSIDFIDLFLLSQLWFGIEHSTSYYLNHWIQCTRSSAINQCYFFGPQWVKHVPIVENCGGMEKNVRFLTVQLHTHVSINVGAYG